MKKFFLFISVLMLAVGASASVQTKDLTLSFSPWSDKSSYDSETKEFTATAAWAGGVLYSGSIAPTNHAQLVISLATAPVHKVRFAVCTRTDTIKVDFETATSWMMEWPNTDTITSIRLQHFTGDASNSCTIDRIYLSYDNGKEVPSELFSGSNDQGGFNWAARLVFPASSFADVKEGSKIQIEYTLGSDSASMAGVTYYQYTFNKSGSSGRLSSNSNETDNNGYLSLTAGTNRYTFTINESDASALKDGGFYLRSKNIKTTKVTLINYYDTYTTEKVLESGSITPNWDVNWSQPASIISSLAAGDVLNVTASGKGSNEWPQVRIAWGGSDGQYVSQGFWSISEFPYVWSHTLTADEVTAIQAANKLYLGGVDVTITKWTLTQTNVMSRDDETASSANNVIWEGSQSINWSGTGEYLQLSGSTLTSLSAGQELRFYYTGTSEDNRQAGAIYNWGNEYILDGGTWRSLDKGASCFVYTLSADNVTNIQSHNLIVSGTGITLTKIEAYTPSAVQTINNEITLSGENIVLNDVRVSKTGCLNVANAVECYDFSINAANGASAQVINPGNLTVNGHVYFDLQLDPSGTVNTNQWYAFSVPFQTDVTAIKAKRGGAYVTLTEGLTNDYLVLEYDGEGWAQLHTGNLQAGKLYMISVNPSVNDLRFTKSGGAIQGSASLDLSIGWNALGNSQLRHVDGAAAGVTFAQVYNSVSDSYTAYALNATSFVVGSAFFVQAASAGTFALSNASHPGALKAPQRDFSASDSHMIQLQLAGDNLFVELSDDAEDTYVIGRDLHKLGNLTSARSALLWAEAYDDRLCAVNMRETNGVVEVPVAIYSPEDGAQTISLVSEPIAGVEISLMHNGDEVCNLSYEATRTLTLNQGVNTGYSLRIREAAKVPTSIVNTNAELSTKRYDILGREVGEGYHGVVIENGKKVIIY